MNKTLLAVALELAYSAMPAWADGGPGGKNDPGDTTTIDVQIDKSDNSTKSGNYKNKGDAAALGLGSTAANNGASAVSYTHLDVYKRQEQKCCQPAALHSALQKPN